MNANEIMHVMSDAPTDVKITWLFTHQRNDQREYHCDKWGATTGAETAAKNITLQKMFALPMALAYTHMLVCFGNYQIVGLLMCSMLNAPIIYSFLELFHLCHQFSTSDTGLHAPTS